MEVLTYVPSNVILVISGWQVRGWNEISVARNTPGFKQIRGIRGKNTRTRVQDTSATLTIRVPQTENMNEVMSAIHDADLEEGTARLEIMLAEVTGNSFFSTATGYITAYPELAYSGDMSERVWTIVCDESSFQVGSARSAAVGIVQNGVSRLKDFVNNTINTVQGVLN